MGVLWNIFIIILIFNLNFEDKLYLQGPILIKKIFYNKIEI